MEAKNKIIQQILLEAKEDSDVIIASKSKQAEALISEGQKENELRVQAMQERCKRVRAEILKNAEGNAELEWKKYRLESKRSLIDKCFNDVLQKLTTLDDKSYLQLVQKLLKSHAVKGDIVKIAKKDSKRITQEFLDKLNLGLKLGDFVDIDGGVIVCSKNYDINLSISTMVEMVKDNTETEVSKILFGGE